MKTDDFKVVLMQLTDKLNQRTLGEVINYKFVETEDELAICINVVNTKVVSVSKKKENHFYCEINSGMNLGGREIVSFIKKIMKYVTTPVAGRENNEFEKRWYVHLLEDADEYLNQNKYEESYFLNNNDEVSGYRTMFTRSEIANYLKTNDEAFVDSFIKRFGEEVE